METYMFGETTKKALSCEGKTPFLCPRGISDFSHNKVN